MSKLKKNHIREGLKLDKKLKKGFYHFLYEKNIDWAIILGVFFLTLPYIASSVLLFLIIKISILIAIVYFIVKYLKTWNSIRQYNITKRKWDEIRKKLVNKEKIENVDFEKAKETTDKVQKELIVIKEKAKKKASQYKDFNEYLKYDKVDFLKLEEILNEDVENNLNALGISISFLAELMVLRTIPREEYNNYKRLLTIISLAIVFFVVYAIEYWLTNQTC